MMLNVALGSGSCGDSSAVGGIPSHVHLRRHSLHLLLHGAGRGQASTELIKSVGSLHISVWPCVAVAHTMQGLRHDYKGGGDRDREGNCVDGVVVGAMVSVGVVLVAVVVAMDCDPCPLVSTSTNRARC